MAPRFLCGFFILLPALLLVPGEANKLAGQVPGCDGCGGDNGANECWTTCGGEARGYCSKCNSAQGTLGACCAQGNADDKDECKLAVGFTQPKYHECVLVQVPECVGCGNRENECWDTCIPGDGNPPRGYCAKCNSAQGTPGACCAQGNADDPDECKRAVGFAQDGSYHECVLLVPPMFSTTPEPNGGDSKATATATTTTTTLHTATVPRCARMPNVMLNKLQEMGFDAIAPPKEDCR